MSLNKERVDEMLSIFVLENDKLLEAASREDQVAYDLVLNALTYISGKFGRAGLGKEQVESKIIESVASTNVITPPPPPTTKAKAQNIPKNAPILAVENNIPPDTDYELPSIRLRVSGNLLIVPVKYSYKADGTERMEINIGGIKAAYRNSLRAQIKELNPVSTKTRDGQIGRFFEIILNPVKFRKLSSYQYFLDTIKENIRNNLKGIPDPIDSNVVAALNLESKKLAKQQTAVPAVQPQTNAKPSVTGSTPPPAGKTKTAVAANPKTIALNEVYKVVRAGGVAGKYWQYVGDEKDKGVNYVKLSNIVPNPFTFSPYPPKRFQKRYLQELVDLGKWEKVLTSGMRLYNVKANYNMLIDGISTEDVIYNGGGMETIGFVIGKLNNGEYTVVKPTPSAGGTTDEAMALVEQIDALAPFIDDAVVKAEWERLRGELAKLEPNKIK